MDLSRSKAEEASGTKTDNSTSFVSPFQPSLITATIPAMKIIGKKISTFNAKRITSLLESKATTRAREPKTGDLLFNAASSKAMI